MPRLPGGGRGLISDCPIVTAIIIRLLNSWQRVGLTIAILATVAAATVVAFGFGAEADIVASMLIIGLVTALAETRMRSGK